MKPLLSVCVTTPKQIAATRFHLASTARRIGEHTARLLADSPEIPVLVAELKVTIPTPTARAVHELAARSEFGFRSRSALHALVWALVHGPAPLGAHLAATSWTSSALDEAWTAATNADEVLPIAARYWGG